MLAQCDDLITAEVVKKFSEELRYSDPANSEAIADSEACLSAAVDG